MMLNRTRIRLFIHVLTLASYLHGELSRAIVPVPADLGANGLASTSSEVGAVSAGEASTAAAMAGEGSALTTTAATEESTGITQEKTGEALVEEGSVEPPPVGQPKVAAGTSQITMGQMIVVGAIIMAVGAMSSLALSSRQSGQSDSTGSTAQGLGTNASQRSAGVVNPSGDFNIPGRKASDYGVSSIADSNGNGKFDGKEYATAMGAPGATAAGVIDRNGGSSAAVLDSIANGQNPFQTFNDPTLKSLPPASTKEDVLQNIKKVVSDKADQLKAAGVDPQKIVDHFASTLGTSGAPAANRALAGEQGSLGADGGPAISGSGSSSGGSYGSAASGALSLGGLFPGLNLFKNTPGKSQGTLDGAPKALTYTGQDSRMRLLPSPQTSAASAGLMPEIFVKVHRMHVHYSPTLTP
jgi:hypothetical protein